MPNLKLKLVLVFAVLGVKFCIAQVSFTDTVVMNPFPKNNMEYLLDDTITNNTSDTITFTWTKSFVSLVTGFTGMYFNDAYAAYPFANSMTNSFSIAPGAKATISVAMKALPTADNGNSFVVLSTNYGNMVFQFISPSATSINAAHENSLQPGIYPNPTSGKFYIRITEGHKFFVVVQNAEGKVLLTQYLQSTQAFDLSQLPAGRYWVSAMDVSGQISTTCLLKSE